MIKVVAAIILDHQKVLIAKRPLNKHQGGKWEFPGGKIDEGESAQQALKRECREELGIIIESPTQFEVIEFDYGDKHVQLNFMLVHKFAGQPSGAEGQEVAWIDINYLKDMDFPEANKPIIEKLIRESL